LSSHDIGVRFSFEDLGRVFRLVVDPSARKISVDGKSFSTSSERALVPLYALARAPGAQVSLENIREVAKELNVSQALRTAGDIRDLIVNKPKWNRNVRECLQRWVSVSKGCLSLRLGDIEALALTEEGEPSSETNGQALKDLTFALDFARVGGVEPGLYARLSGASERAAQVVVPREWTFHANGTRCRLVVLACDQKMESRIEYGGIFGQGETSLIEPAPVLGANPHLIIRVEWDGIPVTPDPLDPCEPYLPKGLQPCVEHELRLELMIRIRNELQGRVAES
jgi:hypothetical protein